MFDWQHRFHRPHKSILRLIIAGEAGKQNFYRHRIARLDIGGFEHHAGSTFADHRIKLVSGKFTTDELSQIILALEFSAFFPRFDFFFGQYQK